MKRVLLTDSRAVLRSVTLILVGVFVAQAGFAQTYTRGRHVEPAFEGWRPNDDGTFNMMFGYMNENWEESPDAPVGENNFFSPGDADRGQPTHFLPRRNRFTFEVTVPADWGDRELVWTLNVNGVERKAYATLRQDYLVDNMVIASETGSLGAGTSSPESRANVPPVVSVTSSCTPPQNGWWLSSRRPWLKSKPTTSIIARHSLRWAPMGKGPGRSKGGPAASCRAATWDGRSPRSR